MVGKPDPEYVKARRVLLDALEALSRQRRAIVVVGAQAVYLHVGESDLAVAPHTTDGDLVIDPSALADSPSLDRALREGGFEATGQPGIWLRDGVEIDLLVPEAVAGAGRRAARLGSHGKTTARKARGLEGALVDCAEMELESLDRDGRRLRVRVAGPAALLVSKLHKIADREGTKDRLADKDALDVLRLLQGVDAGALAQSLHGLAAAEVSRAVAVEALDLLRRLFGRVDGLGAEMAVRATEGLENPETIRGACVALTATLLAQTSLP
jgi:hypothetical protein